MAHIFIIEDDTTLRSELAALLKKNSYESNWCTDFSLASQQALAAQPDCIILDLNLPGASGLDICRDIRSHSNVPIIILTSSDTEHDEVMGMNLGANDYVTKPYRPAALLARIASILRRHDNGGDSLILKVDGVELNQVTNEITYQGKNYEITRNETRILALLMENAGQVISRQELMVALWQSDVFIEDNTLAVNITRLRKKLASISIPDDFLTTKRGAGYCVGFKEGYV